MTPMLGLVKPLAGDEGGAPSFGTQSFESTQLFPDHPVFGWFTNHHFWALIGAIITIIFWVVMSRNLKVVPGRRQVFGEFIYGMIRNGVARDILGHDFGRYKNLMVPYLVALFTFILVNNLFGQFFLVMFPTFSKIGFPYILALLSFILYNAVGIAKWGPKYFARMTVPPGVPIFLLPLIIPLEFLSNFIVRPITLALRLFANLFAGHLVVLVFVVGGGWLVSQASTMYKVAGGVSLVFSLAIFALELLVALIQAYIFTVLTAQYVSSAIAEEH